MMITPGVVLGRLLGRRLGGRCGRATSRSRATSASTSSSSAPATPGSPPRSRPARAARACCSSRRTCGSAARLFSTGGHMSGAGTKIQARHGIEDSVESHLDGHPAHHPRHAPRRTSSSSPSSTPPRRSTGSTSNGFRFDPATPRIVHGHEPYSVAALVLRARRRPVDPRDAARRCCRSRSTPAPSTLWTDSPVIGLRPRRRRPAARARRARPAPRRGRRGRGRRT